MGLCAASTGRAVSRTANLSAVGFAVRGHIIRHVEGQPRRDALFQFFDLELDLLLFFLQSDSFHDKGLVPHFNELTAAG